MAPESVNDRQLPPWLPEALWIAAIAGVLVFTLSSAWGRALDPITDTGRDLSIPQQINAGAKLYRDVLYYYPPLTPYLLAMLTAATGSTLSVYGAIGAGIAILTATAVFMAGRLCAGVHSAGAAGLMFVAGSVYSISGRTTNYLFPYAYATTLAMLFFVTAAVCFLAYLAHKRGLWMGLGVLALFAASWTKIEYAAFSIVMLIVITIVFRLTVLWLGSFIAAGLISVGAVNAFFSDAAPQQHWLWHNVLAPSLLRGEPARFFYRQVSGFDAVGSNLLAAATGAALTVGMAALVWWVSRTGSRGAAIVSLLLMVVAMVLGGATFTRGWAILQFALIPIAIRRRDPILVLIVLALCASSRVILRLFPSFYGFVFVIPTLILIAAVVFDFLPRLGLYSRRAALLWIAPIAVFCVQLLYVERQLLERKLYAVESKQGTFFESNRDRAAVLNAFFAKLEANPADSLVVMPEGLTLNYLSGVPNPLAFHTFTPVETASAPIERQIIEQLNDRQPEAIAIVSRDVSDFGFRGFGVDYNRELAAAIRQQYQVEERWRLAGFELVLLRRAR